MCTGYATDVWICDSDRRYRERDMAGKAGKRRIKKIWIRLLLVLAVLAAAVLIFLGMFYVPADHVDVSGSTRYTADEVKEMVLTDFAHHNSIYLSRFVKTVKPENAPFVNSIEIEYEAHNRIALHVSENSPIGYISQDGSDYYFDADGYVLEALPSSASDTASAAESVTSSSGSETLVPSSGSAAADNTTTASAGTTGTSAGAAASSEGSTGTASNGTTAAAGGTAGATASSASQGAALQADMLRTQDTEYHPALTDVPEITGLTQDTLSVGMTISVDDTSVFSSLLALTKIISKLDIKPDSIEITDGNAFTLHYGDIRIMLGKDTLLEKKMARVAAILPKLSGLKGVLHLENFSDETVNIIFDKDDGSTASDSSSDSSSDSPSESTASDVGATTEGTDTGTSTDNTASDGTTDGTASDTGTDETNSDNASDGTASDAGTDTSGDASYGGYLY